jgi:predicted MFS family arabinose efflux permease
MPGHYADNKEDLPGQIDFQAMGIGFNKSRARIATMSEIQKKKAKAIVSFVLMGVQVAGLFGSPIAAYIGILTANEMLLTQMVSAGIGVIQSFLPAVQDKK